MLSCVAVFFIFVIGSVVGKFVAPRARGSTTAEHLFTVNPPDLCHSCVDVYLGVTLDLVITKSGWFV